MDNAKRSRVVSAGRCPQFHRLLRAQFHQFRFFPSLPLDNPTQLLPLVRGYATPGYVGSKGWVGIYLGDETDWDELADLVEESFRMTAPKRVAGLLDQPGR